MERQVAAAVAASALRQGGVDQDREPDQGTG
jgi:hypothetical protein